MAGVELDVELDEVPDDGPQGSHITSLYWRVISSGSIPDLYTAFILSKCFGIKLSSLYTLVTMLPRKVNIIKSQ